MKIQLVSDTHFEFDTDYGLAFANKLLQPVADTLVLAGDVVPLREWRGLVEIFGWFCDRWKDVVYVPGNHEYYGQRPAEADHRLVKVAEKLPNFHPLNPGAVVIDGQRFLGATMWFEQTVGEENYRRYLSDFRQIVDFEAWVRLEHSVQLQFLADNAGPDDIIVTHHMPHPNSTPPKFANSPLNRFFVTADASQVLAKNPKLWLHGHTHSACDYQIGATRVVCNPRGYPGEKVPAVNLALAIEV